MWEHFQEMGATKLSPLRRRATPIRKLQNSTDRVSCQSSERILTEHAVDFGSQSGYLALTKLPPLGFLQLLQCLPLEHAYTNTMCK